MKSEVKLVYQEQDLEKLVRDVEKGAVRVKGIVLVDTQLYDAECYRLLSYPDMNPLGIRIDLTERREAVGSKKTG